MLRIVRHCLRYWTSNINRPSFASKLSAVAAFIEAVTSLADIGSSLLVLVVPYIGGSVS